MGGRVEERKSNSGDWENLERSKRPMKNRRKNQEKKTYLLAFVIRRDRTS